MKFSHSPMSSLPLPSYRNSSLSQQDQEKNQSLLNLIQACKTIRTEEDVKTDDVLLQDPRLCRIEGETDQLYAQHSLARGWLRSGMFR